MYPCSLGFKEMLIEPGSDPVLSILGSILWPEDEIDINAC